MKAYLLYETDFFHSHASNVLIGVFTNRAKLLAACKRIIKADLKENPEGKEGEDLADYINWNYTFLLEQNQTQGLSSFELQIEEIELNKIID